MANNKGLGKGLSALFTDAAEDYKKTLGVTDDDIKIMLITLSEKISERLRIQGFLCKTVQLQVRTYDLASYVRQAKLPHPCRTAREIFEASYTLFKNNHPKNIASRSISIGACDLIPDDGEQFSFDPDIERIQRRENLEAARDSLCQKFGNGIITRGLIMTDAELCTVNLKNTPGILPGRIEMGEK